jgi:hypothetical protein
MSAPPIRPEAHRARAAVVGLNRPRGIWRAISVACSGVLIALLLLAPSSSGGNVLVTKFQAPYTQYGATKHLQLSAGGTGCRGVGSGQTVFLSPHPNLSSGVASVRAKSTLVSCNGTAGDEWYSPTIGLLNLRFTTPVTGTYNISATWNLSYQFTLSMQLNGSVVGSANYYDEASIVGNAHIWDQNNSSWQDTVSTLAVDCQLIHAGTSTCAQKNFTFAFGFVKFNKLHLVAGHVYVVSSSLAIDVQEYAAGVPAGSAFHSTVDLAPNRGYGATLQSVTVTR